MSYQFDASESSFTRTLAAGHFSRLGHTLKGVWVETDGIRKLQRTCCGKGK